MKSVLVRFEYGNDIGMIMAQGGCVSVIDRQQALIAAAVIFTALNLIWDAQDNEHDDGNIGAAGAAVSRVNGEVDCEDVDID